MSRRCARAISLIFGIPLVLVVLLWVRSYRTVDYIQYARSTWYMQVCSDNGSILIQVVSSDSRANAPWLTYRTCRLNDFNRFHHPICYLISHIGEVDYDRDRWDCRINYLVISLALTVPLLIQSLSYYLTWRRRFHHPGLCHSCGYDLRATPDRCPECGRKPQDS